MERHDNTKSTENWLINGPRAVPQRQFPASQPFIGALDTHYPGASRHIGSWDASCVRLPLLLISVLLIALTPMSCATLDAKSSYDEASDLIASRTGVPGVYSPDAPSDPAAERVRDALEGGLTLDEAIMVALLNNPAFQAQFLEIGVSQADLLQSSLLTNPTLSFSLGVPDVSGRSRLGGSLVQSLTELWQLPLRKRIAESKLERTVLHAANAAIELRAEVKTKYFALLALNEAQQQADTGLHLVQRSLALAQQQFDAGDTGIQDVYLAEAALLDGQDKITELARDRAQASAQLYRLMGVIRIASATELTDRLPEPFLMPIDSTALLLQATRQRLDAQSAVLDMRIAAEEVRRERRSRIPSFSLGIDVERTEEASQSGVPESSDTPKENVIKTVAGPSIELVLPIWDQNQAQIRKSEIAAIQRHKELDNLLDRVASELVEAEAAFNAANSSVVLLRDKAIPLAVKNVELARIMYEAGEQSVYPLLFAQQALLDRERAYGRARADFGAAYAELERAVGGNLDWAAAAKPADATEKVTD